MPSDPPEAAPVKETGKGGAGEDGARTPLFLNVYDLTSVNKYLYWLGLGVFHSGIEVHGMEYAFGAHDYSASGVFEVEPRGCPGFIFRRSVWLGSTEMSPQEFRSFLEDLAGKYHGDTYHLFLKNCNHFTDEVCRNMTGKPIPGWVNRLARLGSFLNCLLPDKIQVAPVGQLPVNPAYSEDGSDSNASTPRVVESDDEDFDHHLLKPTPDNFETPDIFGTPDNFVTENQKPVMLARDLM